MQAKPLPVTVRSAIARAMLARSDWGCAPELMVKKHANKQMVLTLVEGPFKRTLIRLHKKLHRQFYQIVAAAKKLLATLVSAMADPLPAPVALLPATVPVRAAAPSPVRGVPAWSNTGKDTPRSRYEAADVAAHRTLTPRQIYERNVRFNRAKVQAQVTAGLQ